MALHDCIIHTAIQYERHVRQSHSMHLNSYESHWRRPTKRALRRKNQMTIDGHVDHSKWIRINQRHEPHVLFRLFLILYYYYYYFYMFFHLQFLLFFLHLFNIIMSHAEHTRTSLLFWFSSSAAVWIPERERESACTCIHCIHYSAGSSWIAVDRVSCAFAFNVPNWLKKK